MWLYHHFIGHFQPISKLRAVSFACNYHHFIGHLQLYIAKKHSGKLVITIILSATYSTNNDIPINTKLVITIILSATYSPSKTMGW